MGAVTIRNLPDDVIQRVKAVAEEHGRSMEQELRELIQTRYMSKASAIAAIRGAWTSMPPTKAEEVQRWRDAGRP